MFGYRKPVGATIGRPRKTNSMHQFYYVMKTKSTGRGGPCVKSNMVYKL